MATTVEHETYTNPAEDWLFEAMRPQRHRPPAKWAPGEPVTSVEEFLALCHSGKPNHFFWIGPIDGRFKGRAVHSGWAMNRPFALTLAEIKRGNIRRAVVSPAYAEWIAAEHAAISGDAA